MAGDLASINGKWMQPEEATVPIHDRGLLFADAVYEMLRCYRGRMWIPQAHRDRLQTSLNGLQIEGVDLDWMFDHLADGLQLSGLSEATIYIQISRGCARRGHAFPRPPVEPTILVMIQHFDDSALAEMREQGASAISLPDHRWRNRHWKTTNLLANVLALEEAKRQGAFEAVLVDQQGRVTEATHCSLLWVEDGRLLGTPEGPEILPGTTRHCVEQWARDLFVPVASRWIELEQLRSVDELMVVGTTSEVMPIIQLDDRKIGTGQPGPITGKLQSRFRQAIDQLGGFAEPSQLATEPV